MDLDDSVLSNQHVVVKELSTKFKKVTVVTGRIGRIDLPENVSIIQVSINQKYKLLFIFQFIKQILSLFLNNKVDLIFCHMTDMHSAIIAPFSFIFRKPHYLWYCHKHKSLFLSFAHIFVDGVITCTTGSCPINSQKVQAIGHGINQNVFIYDGNRDLENLNKLVHMGRFDISKRIDALVDFLRFVSVNNSSITLTLYGNTIDAKSKKWSEELIKINQDLIPNKLIVRPGVSRETLPVLLKEFDVFVHAYKGSLDKALLEATFVGIPVLTENTEYIKVFQSWSGKNKTTLIEEYEALKKYSVEQLSIELHRRSKLAIAEHSLDPWIDKLTKILKNNKIRKFAS